MPSPDTRWSAKERPPSKGVMIFLLFSAGSSVLSMEVLELVVK